MNLLPSPSSRRLFVGLMPDAKVRAAIQKHCQDWEWPLRHKYRLTNPARLHMTLHFPEQVARAREPALHAALQGIPMEPLELTLRTPMAWAHGIAVLLPDEHAGLRALHDRIEHALQLAGFASHINRWTPHVTLAREAPHAKPPEAAQGIRWVVREFALIWSQLPPAYSSARYQVLERYGRQ